MTDEQKTIVNDLRERGFGYRKIAARLGISPNTVKTHMRRKGLTTNPDIVPEIPREFCLQCGADMSNLKRRKGRKFCSVPCRRAWWKLNTNLINRRAWYDCVCAGCGENFKSYGNKKRKYCGHTCYISARFKKGAVVG